MALNVSEPIPAVTDVSSPEKLKLFFFSFSADEKNKGEGESSLRSRPEK